MTGHVKRALSAVGLLSLIGLVEARPINTEPCLGMTRVRFLGPVDGAPSEVMSSSTVRRVGGFAYEKSAVMLVGGEKREELRGSRDCGDSSISAVKSESLRDKVE